MYKVAVILPAYNEELTIGETIRDFGAALPTARFVVVNNNSSDNTRAIAERVLTDSGLDGEVLDEYRQGKGYAVRKALKDIEAEVYVLADADMTYPARSAPEMIDLVLLRGADMVVGDRHTSGGYRRENSRIFHNFGNKLVTRLVNRLFRSQLNDIMSGYRVFSRKFIMNYPILVDGFELETDMTLHALDKRMHIIEYPIDYVDRTAGSHSKLNTFSDGARVLFAIFQLLRYYRPLAFFGGLFFFFFFAGILCGIPAIIDYVSEGYVYHLPLAVLAIGSVITAVISLAVGLILDSINHTNRMQFEKNY